LARALATALLVLVLLLAGCGGEGASSGATVSVYAAAPLCAEVRSEVGRSAGKAGDLEVHAVCLPAVKAGKGVDLAAVGRNARRATEDSTAVAFLEAPGRAARFGRSIVEAANLAWVETRSGSAAARRVLRALASAGSSSPREAVLDEVG
jgi:hypothetical protein